MKKKAAIIVVIELVLCVLGVFLYEPEVCPLCNTGETEVPCVIDLHTGKFGEIRIGNRNLSDDPSSFVFYLVHVAGCKGYCDTSARCCRLELDQLEKTFNRFLFCRSCREKLQECQHTRYAVLDLRQPDAVVYPVAVGSFSIGEYQIDITSEGEVLLLLATLQ